MFDLHVHSCYSDGSLDLKELVNLYKEKGMAGIAITDHDSVGIYEYIDSLKEDEKKRILNGFYIVPGIEISSEYYDEEIHILGLDIDYNYEGLKDYCIKAKEMRIKRIQKIFSIFKEHNIYLDMNEIKTHSSIGLPHIGQELVRKSYVKDVNEAFKKYLYKGSPFRVKKDVLEVKDVIKLINDAGGYSFLAHPGEISNKNIINELLPYLDGIEVYHPSNDFFMVNKLLDMSKKYGLLVSGGSDFHNINKDGNNIGRYKVNIDGLNMERMIGNGKR